MISFLQFIFAVLIIAFHNTRIFPSDEWNFIQKNLFSRLAVPFFISASAFFVRYKSSEKKGFQQNYVKKQLKSYFIWSLIYIPYGWFYFSSLEVSNGFLPLGVLIAIFYIGMCYHLWYLPAFIFGSAIIHLINRHLNLLVVTAIAFGLFLIGSVETYYGYLTNTWFATGYENYAQLFFTTRNGLFFTPVFVCLGYLIYDYRDHSLLTKNHGIKLISAFLLLCLEAYLIYVKPGMDKNFLLGLIPATFFLFNWGIRTSFLMNLNLNRLKKLSVFYFFIHPLFIEILLLSPLPNRLDTYKYAWISLLVTLVGTHLLATLLLFLIEKKEQMLLIWHSFSFNRDRL